MTERMTRQEAIAKGLNVYFTGKSCPKGHVAMRRVSGACLECQNNLFRNYRKSRKDNLNANSKLWREANLERQKELTRTWLKANKDAVNAYCAARRAAKKNATPFWADLKAIAAVYTEAAQKGLSVDHIVPLQGRNVCGLHVHWNLQLLTFAENASKGNRFESGI